MASGPESIPTQAESPAMTVARLSRALGLPPEKVEAAFHAVGMTPAEAFTSILHGEGEEKVARLAKELKVARPRLALALLDAAVATTSTWASAAGGLGEKAAGVAGRIRERASEWWVEVVEFVVEVFAETIPRVLNRVTLVLVLAGGLFVGMGVLALVDQALFLKVALYVLGGAMVLFGAGLVWVAWRIHEATASLRTLARLARRWRDRRRSRDEE